MKQKQAGYFLRLRRTVMKKLLWGLFSVFLCVAFVGPAGALVWEIADGGNGHEYEIYYFESGQNKSWESARTALDGTAYTLAAITSLEEQRFIESYLNSYSEKRGDLWIGGYQDPWEAVAGEGWHWITDEKWVYESWINGEANDYYDGAWQVSNSEKFLSVRSAFGWGWNDEGNLNNISGYLAETAPVPEPGTILLMGFGLLGLAAVGRKKFIRF
jgi:hypothetical protein